MDKRQRESQEQRQQDIQTQQVRIDFSFKREVFFIVAGALLGGVAMAFPLTFLSVGSDIHNTHTGYYLTWVVFGHILGVNSPITATITAGFTIHFLTATCIGILAGVFLYKTNILNISKPSNGLRFGLLVGIIVYLVFAIPVEQVVLNQEFRRVTPLSEQTTANSNRNNNNVIIPLDGFQLRSTITTIMMHLLFGITLGLFSSFLSIKFGARYLCPKHCEISFSRIDTLQNHLKIIHRDNPIQNTKRILILGGGFGGVGVLNKLQQRYQTDVSIDMVIVNKDNYLLFTPMLHEIASGTIETRHIVTPIRTFCKRSRFYCASVESIDLENKKVKIKSSLASSVQQHGLLVGDSIDSVKTDGNYLRYDYLVIAIGSDTKFFGMLDVQHNSFTIKSLNDAIKLRNHIIYLLEQADQLLPQYYYDNTSKYIELQKLLLTFVIVGGGFAGVETAGELNDFIRDSIKEFYHNIDKENVRIIIVNQETDSCQK